MTREKTNACTTNEFTVQNPAGDVFRVLTLGDSRQAILDAQHATGDVRDGVDLSGWKLLSWSHGVTASPSVRRLDAYEKRKFLDVMELNAHSAAEMDRLTREAHSTANSEKQ